MINYLPICLSSQLTLITSVLPSYSWMEVTFYNFTMLREKNWTGLTVGFYTIADVFVDSGSTFRGHPSQPEYRECYFILLLHVYFVDNGFYMQRSLMTARRHSFTLTLQMLLLIVGSGDHASLPEDAVSAGGHPD